LLPPPDRVQTVTRLLMLVALYSVPVVVCLQPAIDWDLWWHLRVGQWVVDNGAVPQHDPFSAYGQDKPWVAYSWLFEVLVYGSQRAFGLTGALIYQTTLALAVVAAVHRLVARREPRFPVATALTALAVLALAALFKQRPWMFTILFITLTLDVVLDLRAGRKNRLTSWLPLLYVLWANIHIQFVYGLFILGLACVAPVIDSGVRRLGTALHEGPCSNSTRSQLALYTVSALCMAATLLTPYHFRIYSVVFEYATQPGPFRFVNELRALEFREVPDWVMLALGAAATFALGRRPRLSCFDVILLAAATFFAFRARRDLWFLVLAALAVLTTQYQREVESSTHFAFSRRRAGFVIAALALLIPVVWQARRLSEARLEQAVAEVFPVEAVRVLRERGYAGPMFNDFDWGGYLIWSLPEHPVLVDGRTNLHGDERLTRLGATWAGAPGWRDDPDLAAARLVLVNASTPLAALLESDQRFERVYTDDLARVFVARQR
jgi:hypothetical protein